MGARTAAWGVALGERRVSNDDLSGSLDTSDAWIAERTGIRARHVGGTTSSLAIRAGKEALSRWDGDPADIQCVMVATSTPDQAMPASASTVQAQLGLSAGAFDLNAACSGFVYGLVTAFGLIAQGSGPILLIGSDAMSTIVDWSDRATAVLFGDGAGAAVIEPVEGGGEMLGWDIGSDGTLAHLLYADLASTVVMDGKEVFRRAVRVVVDSVHSALHQAGLEPADVDHFVPHQANERIISAACSRLGLPESRVVSVLAETANTSAASIPIAMASAIEAGRLAAGDRVLVAGFGAGMSWASAVLEWHP